MYDNDQKAMISRDYSEYEIITVDHSEALDFFEQYKGKFFNILDNNLQLVEKYINCKLKAIDTENLISNREWFKVVLNKKLNSGISASLESFKIVFIGNSEDGDVSFVIEHDENNEEDNNNESSWITQKNVYFFSLEDELLFKVG